MDTIKGWLGYGNATVKVPAPEPPAEKTADTANIKVDVKAVIESNNNDNQKAEHTTQTVDSEKQGLLEALNTWARTKIPLEPEDRVEFKLLGTSFVTFSIVCAYQMPRQYPLYKTHLIFRATNRASMAALFGAFMVYEWYLPLYKKYDEDGKKLPRSFMGYVEADINRYQDYWKSMTGQNTEDKDSKNSQNIAHQANTNNNSAETAKK